MTGVSAVAPRGVLVRGRVALAFVITRHRSPPSHSPRGAATRNTNTQQPTHDRPRCRSIIQHQRVHATSRLDFTPAPLVRRKTRGALCATFRQRGAANTAVAIEEVPPSASIQTSFIATWCSKDERGREGERSAAGRLAALSPTHVPHSGRALPCPASDQKNFWRTPRVEACLAANVAAAAIAPSPAAHPAATFGPEVALYSIPVRAAPPAGLSRSSSPRML